MFERVKSDAGWKVLTAVLLLLTGLEVIAIAPEWLLLAAGLGSILLELLARTISVGIFLALMKRKIDIEPLNLTTLNGTVCVEASLSHRLCHYRKAQSARLFSATYTVVLFAVIVLGASISKLIVRIKQRAQLEDHLKSNPEQG